MAMRAVVSIQSQSPAILVPRVATKSVHCHARAASGAGITVLEYNPQEQY